MHALEYIYRGAREESQEMKKEPQIRTAQFLLCIYIYTSDHSAILAPKGSRERRQMFLFPEIIRVFVHTLHRARSERKRDAGNFFLALSALYTHTNTLDYFLVYYISEQ